MSAVGRVNQAAASTLEGSRTLNGRLVFTDDLSPEVEIKVRFYAKTFFGGQEYLGSAKTDRTGRFTFHYEWQARCWQRTHEVVVEMIEQRRPFATQGLFCAKNKVAIGTANLSFPANQMENDIGDYHLAYRNIPTDLTVVEKPVPSHMQSPSFFWKLTKAAFPELVKNLLVKLFQTWVTVPQVQKLYDSFGAQYAKRAATPDRLIEELLNEICAVDCEEKEGQVSWKAEWDHLEFDMQDSLPNVIVVAQKEKGDLKLKHIEIQFREDLEPRRIPTGDEKLEWGIFVARSVFALKGEAEVHLAEGHLLPGLAAKAFFKHIKPSNPIFAAAAPHAGQLDFINWIGAQGVIFGKGSVLEISSLSDQSVSRIILDHMKKKADYTKDIPTVPINHQHVRARVSALHYQILLQYFQDLVRGRRQEIVNCKEQIFRWSESMHSKLRDIPKIMASADEFTPQDEERLIRCLAWFVHKTTFLHWSAHSRQQILTDIRTAALAMRKFGLDSTGKLAFGGNMDPVKVNSQLFTARLLLNFEGASLTQNPYGDVDPELIRRIQERKAEYLPYQVDEMTLTTQI